MTTTADVWADRDFPILEEVAASEGPHDITVEYLLNRLSMDRQEVILGVRALAEAEYVKADPVLVNEEFLPIEYHDIRLLERGRRTVGHWPSENALEDFLAVVEQAIDSEPDQVKRSAIQRFKESLLTIGQGTSTAILIEWLKRQLPFS